MAYTVVRSIQYNAYLRANACSSSCAHARVHACMRPCMRASMGAHTFAGTTLCAP